MVHGSTNDDMTLQKFVGLIVIPFYRVYRRLFCSIIRYNSKENNYGFNRWYNFLKVYNWYRNRNVSF